MIAGTTHSSTPHGDRCFLFNEAGELIIAKLDPPATRKSTGPRSSSRTTPWPAGRSFGRSRRTRTDACMSETITRSSACHWRRSDERRRSIAAAGKAVLLQPADQGAAGHAEQSGGLRLVAVGGRERLQKRFSLAAVCGRPARLARPSGPSTDRYSADTGVHGVRPPGGPPRADRRRSVPARPRRRPPARWRFPAPARCPANDRPAGAATASSSIWSDGFDRTGRA